MSSFNFIQAAEEVISAISINRQSAEKCIKEILKLSKINAVLVTAYVVERAPNEEMKGRFLRELEKAHGKS